jgi:hypothetical protein
MNASLPIDVNPVLFYISALTQFHKAPKTCVLGQLEKERSQFPVMAFASLKACRRSKARPCRGRLRKGGHGTGFQAGQTAKPRQGPPCAVTPRKRTWPPSSNDRHLKSARGAALSVDDCKWRRVFHADTGKESKNFATIRKGNRFMQGNRSCRQGRCLCHEGEG